MFSVIDLIENLTICVYNFGNVNNNLNLIDYINIKIIKHSIYNIYLRLISGTIIHINIYHKRNDEYLFNVCYTRVVRG